MCEPPVLCNVSINIVKFFSLMYCSSAEKWSLVYFDNSLITGSSEGIAITRRLKEAGEIMGIKVLDHIIVGEGEYLSF
jgi:hypothetical protein